MSAVRYMLDTDIVSDLLKHPHGKVSKRIRLLGSDAACISIVTAAELRIGAFKRGAQKLTELINGLLDEINVAPIDAPFDQDYAEIRFLLERSEQPVGPNDLLIAAHARSLGAILVTNNEREMRRVHNLTVENWLS